MNPALLFVALILLLAAGVTYALIAAMRRDREREMHEPRPAEPRPNSVGSSNIEALRIERAELDRDLKLGLLTPPTHAEAVDELEARVLREAALDRDSVVSLSAQKKSIWARASFALGLPLIALFTYFFLGSPHAVIPEIVRPPQSEQDAQMDALFKGAEAKLKENPTDDKGWYLLARAQASVGRFDDALKSYEKLLALTPNDADAWADFADAAAGKAQGTMAGRPLELITRSLSIDPKQPKALLLRGTHEIQLNDLVAAEKTFTLAKSLLDPTTGFASIADNALKDIAARRGTSAAVATPPNASETMGKGLFDVKINISAEAKAASEKSGGAAIFLIVRAPDQERGPPLAAKKLSVAEALAAPVSIGASDAMIGGTGLAVGQTVTVEARLSLSGQPAAQPGDFASQKRALKLGDTASLALSIDSQR